MDNIGTVGMELLNAVENESGLQIAEVKPAWLSLAATVMALIDYIDDCRREDDVDWTDRLRYCENYWSDEAHW